MYIILIILQIFISPTTPMDNIVTYEYDNSFDKTIIQLDTLNKTFQYHFYSCLSQELDGTYEVKGDKLKLKFNYKRRFRESRQVVNYRFSNNKTQFMRKTRRHTYIYELKEQEKSKTLE